MTRLSGDGVLERIAEIILNEPSATVGDIARYLGYSEQKSVYYWLDKAGYKSIRSFRDAVLTGRFPRRRPRLPEVIGETRPGHDLGSLPVVSLAPGRVEPTGRSLGQAWHPGLSAAAFAYRMPGQVYAPLLLAGDYLIVDPERRLEEAALILAREDRDGALVFRYYTLGPATLLLHPVTGRAHQGRPAVLGPILGVLRGLPV